MAVNAAGVPAVAAVAVLGGQELQPAAALGAAGRRDGGFAGHRRHCSGGPAGGGGCGLRWDHQFLGDGWGCWARRQLAVGVVGACERLAAFRGARRLAGTRPWREALRCGVRGPTWLVSTRSRSFHGRAGMWACRGLLLCAYAASRLICALCCSLLLLHVQEDSCWAAGDAAPPLHRRGTAAAIAAPVPGLGGRKEGGVRPHDSTATTMASGTGVCGPPGEGPQLLRVGAAQALAAASLRVASTLGMGVCAWRILRSILPQGGVL